MKHYICFALTFVAGVTTGVFATKEYFKKKYADLAQEEIDSVIEAFSETKLEKDEESGGSVEEPTKEEVAEYVKKTREYGYNTMNDEEAEESVKMNRAPYVISPVQFGENPEYEQISLTFYADQVLTDDEGNVMTSDEIEAAVGLDALTHFGEHEEDAVHVRNDSRRCEYEILFDYRNYEDTVNAKPPYKQEE